MTNFFAINDDQCNIPISTVDYMLLMSNIIVIKSKIPNSNSSNFDQFFGRVFNLQIMFSVILRMLIGHLSLHLSWVILWFPKIYNFPPFGRMAIFIFSCAGFQVCLTVLSAAIDHNPHVRLDKQASGFWKRPEKGRHNMTRDLHCWSRVVLMQACGHRSNKYCENRGKQCKWLSTLPH